MIDYFISICIYKGYIKMIINYLNIYIYHIFLPY